MTQKFNTFMLLAMFVLIGGFTTGCNSGLKAEHERLLGENEDLRNELTNTQAALSNASSDRDRLNLELNDLKKQQEEQAKAKPVTTDANQGNGFANINGVTVIPGAGQITLRIPGDVLFASGQTSLRSNAKTTLQRIVSVIKSKYNGNTIRVEGHTDTDPIKKSKWKDNLELSSARAMSVHRYLATLGVNSKQLYSAGFADSKPRGTKAASRRVEIVVLQ